MVESRISNNKSVTQFIRRVTLLLLHNPMSAPVTMSRIKALLVLMRYLSSTLGQVWFRDRCISSHRGHGEVLFAPVEDFIIKKI